MNTIPIPAERDREEPMFCLALMHSPPEFERPASLSAPIDYARRLVADLLTTSCLNEVLDPSALRVIIGEGNWISYECSFWDYLKCDSQSLRPCLKPAALRKILALTGAQDRRAWFRMRTGPSLHYFVYLEEGLLKLKGHIDAAAPLAKPFVHLVHDYLPAHGIGTHPTPQQLWAAYKPRR
jgi:hypothetical protein